MSETTERLPCTCTAIAQPCDACLQWRDTRLRTRRGSPRTMALPAIELRLRGLTHHYEPAATTPLLVPLAPLEVIWL